jgi:hypothetical protein
MFIAFMAAMQAPPVDYLKTPQASRAIPPERAQLFYEAFDDKRLPQVRDIEQAEQVLARFPCVGSMRRWVRRYAFARNAKTLRVDPSLIRFEFVTAGYRGRRAGREVVPFAALMQVDDGDFGMANGVYSIRTHLATLSYCGPNRPPPPKRGK